MPTPAERLRKLRKSRGMTVPTLAHRAEIGESTVRAHESQQNKITPAAAEAYAAALGTSAAFILFGQEVDPNVRRVPVIGPVQAGVWFEMPDELPEPREYLPFLDTRFAHASIIYGLVVQGTSMNLMFHEGATVFVVPTAEAGLFEHDIVVVKRSSRGGSIETTLKQITMDGNQILLCPRSSDPKFQEPIVFTPDRDPNQNIGIEIVGVVVGTYRKIPTRSGRMIRL